MTGALGIGREDLNRVVLAARNHIAVWPENGDIDELAEQSLDDRSVGRRHEELDFFARFLSQAVGHWLVQLKLGDGLLCRHNRKGQRCRILALLSLRRRCQAQYCGHRRQGNCRCMPASIQDNILENLIGRSLMIADHYTPPLKRIGSGFFGKGSGACNKRCSCRRFQVCPAVWWVNCNPAYEPGELISEPV